MFLPRLLAHRSTQVLARQQQHGHHGSSFARKVYNHGLNESTSSAVALSSRVAPFSTSSARLDAKPPPDPTPNPTETSKSGGGDAGAAHSDTAFDPNTTSPEQEEASSSSDNKSSNDPLKVSPADKDANTTKDGRAEGATDSKSKAKR